MGACDLAGAGSLIAQEGKFLRQGNRWLYGFFSVRLFKVIQVILGRRIPFSFTASGGILPAFFRKISSILGALLLLFLLVLGNPTSGVLHPVVNRLAVFLENSGLNQCRMKLARFSCPSTCLFDLPGASLDYSAFSKSRAPAPKANRINIRILSDEGDHAKCLRMIDVIDVQGYLEAHNGVQTVVLLGH